MSGNSRGFWGIFQIPDFFSPDFFRIPGFGESQSGIPGGLERDGLDSRGFRENRLGVPGVLGDEKMAPQA